MLLSCGVSPGQRRLAFALALLPPALSLGAAAGALSVLGLSRSPSVGRAELPLLGLLASACSVAVAATIGVSSIEGKGNDARRLLVRMALTAGFMMLATWRSRMPRAPRRHGRLGGAGPSAHVGARRWPSYGAHRAAGRVTTMLKATNLFKKLGGRAVLDRLEMGCQASEVLLVIGRNGAGKSTLLRVLAGLLEPDDGLVTLDGHSVFAAGAVARRQIGYLPDATDIFPELTVRELVELVEALKQIPATEEQDEAWRARLGLEDLRNQRLRTLSLGQRKRALRHGSAGRRSLAAGHGRADQRPRPARLRHHAGDHRGAASGRKGNGGGIQRSGVCARAPEPDHPSHRRGPAAHDRRRIDRPESDSRVPRTRRDWFMASARTAQGWIDRAVLVRSCDSDPTVDADETACHPDLSTPTLRVLSRTWSHRIRLS